MASNFDRELDAAIVGGVKLIGKFFKNVWQGLKKLKTLKGIIGLIISILVSVAVCQLRERLYELLTRPEMPGFMQKVVYIIFLAAPMIYLAILGSMVDKEQEEYKEKFETIGFKGRTGYPYFISKTEDELRRITYNFKSDMPLSRWKKSQESLETALECSIFEIVNVKSKKVVKISAIPSDFELPEEIAWDNKFISEKDGEIVLGQSQMQLVKFNLNRSPHVLIAGTTGSGKSVILKSATWQMIVKGAKVYMFDFKGGVEFGKAYEKYGEVITERDRAIEVLKDLFEENKKRLAVFRDMEVKNLSEYNKKTGKNLSRIIIASDEVAEMLDKNGASKEEKQQIEEIVKYISSLARLARATGINLLLGTQRPDANVITGQIKNNLPVRICGRFSDRTASEIVLNNSDATKLPKTGGRFLFQEGNEQVEFQAFYFIDAEAMKQEVNIKPGELMIHSSSNKDYYSDDSAFQRDYAFEPVEIKPKEESPVKDLMDFNYDDEVFSDGDITWSVDE